MDTPTALARVAVESQRSSRALVAEAIGVDPSVVSRWIAGESRPTGKTRLRLIRWAEELPPPVPPPDVLEQALQRTGDSLVRLAEITGYAKAVLSMLRGVADEQARVVQSLEPWSALESGLQTASGSARATLHRAAQTPTPPSDSGSPRPDTGAGDPHIAATPDGAASAAPSRRRR